MNFSNLYSNNWQRSIKNDDGDDDEPREAQDKRDDLLMLNKRLEKLFFDKRAVYLWGVVDDKSAREITTKLMLLEADKPDEEIKF
ncbi:MAG TPA: ATP-dependent Clp protease proteolytic subunit, partial [Niabella sp.]|nr:ATP-dependent Clp protease proteolytic subunit [Niabella sp.]